MTRAEQRARRAEWVRLYAGGAGLTMREIGARFGVTATAVSYALKAAGASPTLEQRRKHQAAATRAITVHWTPEMDAALRQMRAGRTGVALCGEIIGVAPSVVTARIDALGLARFPSPRQAA